MNFKAVNVSPMEKVFSTAAPSEEGAREKLSGLKGEIVSFQIAYYAESQGFARAEAEVISPIREQVQLRKVALVPCEYPCGPVVDEDYITTAPGLYPDRGGGAEASVGRVGQPEASGSGDRARCVRRARTSAGAAAQGL